jgi:hypothetical protein
MRITEITAIFMPLIAVVLMSIWFEIRIRRVERMIASLYSEPKAKQEQAEKQRSWPRNIPILQSRKPTKKIRQPRSPIEIAMLEDAAELERYKGGDGE